MEVRVVVVQVAPRQGAYSYAASLQRMSLGNLTSSAGGITSRSGVRPGPDLLVQANGTPNMSVNVNGGMALVQTASVLGGIVPFANNGTLNVAIGAAHATYPRIDTIACVWYDEEDGTASAGNSKADIIKVAGTASGSPVAPTLPTNSLKLADITVNANASSITSGNVADKRTFTAAAGGGILCTSATRPTGNQLYPGLEIFESDSGNQRYWDGTQWRGGQTQEIQVAGAPYNNVTAATLLTLCQYAIPAQPVPCTVKISNYTVIDKTVLSDVFDIGIARDGGASIRVQGTGDVGRHWCIGCQHSFSLAAGISTTVQSTVLRSPGTGTITTYGDARLNYMLITITPS